MISSETSANKLFSLVNKFLGNVVINHELLDANRVQYARSDLAQRQRTQQNYCNRKVDVEAVRDEADHVHMSHYLFRSKKTSCSSNTKYTIANSFKKTEG